jgi:paraquat-inducible protein B
MPEPVDRDDLPQATVSRPRRTKISVVWIIPILAAVIGLGIAIQRLMTEGPTITIVFRNAEGIEAGKTFVKYKDVNIGHVSSVVLTDGYGKVEVTAKITKSAAGLMVEDAKFWVVSPRITLSVDEEPAALHRPR